MCYLVGSNNKQRQLSIQDTQLVLMSHENWTVCDEIALQFRQDCPQMALSIEP